MLAPKTDRSTSRDVMSDGGDLHTDEQGEEVNTSSRNLANSCVYEKADIAQQQRSAQVSLKRANAERMLAIGRGRKDKLSVVVDSTSCLVAFEMRVLESMSRCSNRRPATRDPSALCALI